MSVQQKQLEAFGFVKLPDFNPNYFKYRNKVGFLLFLNETLKLSYQLFTINAHSCISSAKRLVCGEDADRALDLKEALVNSELTDWSIYFRPNGLYPGLKESVSELVQDYATLNTNRSRINQNEATWAYLVFHEGFKRGFTIISNKQLVKEEIIGKFLRQWRRTLDNAVNRGRLALPLYYAGCEQITAAMQEWMRGDITNFSIVEVEQLAGKPRSEVTKQTEHKNARMTVEYQQSLAT